MGSVAITGTGGQFSFTGGNLAVGDAIKISGTYGGTGSITGYANPTTYYVSATNGTSTFTLQSTAHAAIVTTAGTPTGLTYTLAAKALFNVSIPSTEIFLNSMKGVAIASNDTTTTKTAVLLIDTSQFKLTDVQIGTTTNKFTGGSAAPNPCGTLDTQVGSIGLRMCGREWMEAGQNQILADRPIVFSADPNIASETIDTSHFQDTYLIGNLTATTNPLIWVDSNVVLTNVIFDGAEGWAGGCGGFYWNDTTETNGSYGVRFDNVRYEQGQCSTAYEFYMSPHVSTYDVSFHNVVEQAGGNMFFFRNLQGVYAESLIYGVDTGTVFNLTESDYSVSWKNAFINTSATNTISGMNLVSARYAFYPTITLPVDAIYENDQRIAQTTVGSPLSINMVQSGQPYSTYAPSWTTGGLGLSMPAWTGHDTTGTGTIAVEAMSALSAPTLTATSAMTATDLDTLYLAAPVASTNVTATNLISLETAGPIRVPAGSSSALALQFGQANNGIYAGAGYWYGYAGGTNTFLVNGSTFQVQGLLLSIGTSDLQGNVNFGSGNTLLLSTTAPTISSGFGTGPSVPVSNGTASFTVNVGTGAAATSGVIGMPAAAHGWACAVHDVTTPAGNSTTQTGSSTTTVTVTNYSRTTGLASAWPASDILELTCMAN
jgi:hypothetical protein